MIKNLSTLALIVGLTSQSLASQPQVPFQPNPRSQTAPIGKGNVAPAIPNRNLSTGGRQNLSPAPINSGRLLPSPPINALIQPGELPGEIDETINDRICRKVPTRALRILSIDGGGVRGIIPSLVVQEIEKVLELPISIIMDAFGGTSVGGILSLTYTKPKAMRDGVQIGLEAAYTADEIVDLSSSISKAIFESGKSVVNLVQKGAFYEKGPLINVLAKYFGDTKISQTLKPVYITAFDLNSESTFIISTTLAKYGLKRNETRKDANRMPLSTEGSDPKISLPSNIQKKEWPFDLSYIDAARATSAAPLYFPVQPLVIDADSKTKMQLVDGGVGNNNPVNTVIREIDKAYCTPPAIKVLSLGTGVANQYYGDKDFQVQGGPLRMLAPTITGLFRVQEENANDSLKDKVSIRNDLLAVKDKAFIRNEISPLKSEYNRFQVYLERGLDKLDDASPRMLKLLEAKGKEIISSANFKRYLIALQQDLCNEGVYCAREKLARKEGLHKKMCPASRVACVINPINTNPTITPQKRNSLPTVNSIRPSSRTGIN